MAETNLQDLEEKIAVTRQAIENHEKQLEHNRTRLADLEAKLVQIKRQAYYRELHEEEARKHDMLMAFYDN